LPGRDGVGGKNVRSSDIQVRTAAGRDIEMGLFSRKQQSVIGKDYMMKINKRKWISGMGIIFVIMALQLSVLALPPDPENAALLYYQAFCSYEKPDAAIDEKLWDLAKGKIQPDPEMIKYIESCHPAIELAVKAAELDSCDWGILYSERLNTSMRYAAEAKALFRIIMAEARIAFSQAKYDLALERCLTARKLGIDAGSSSSIIGFLIDRSSEKNANYCIQDILSCGTLDLRTLENLKSQLSELDSMIRPIEFYFKAEQELMASYITLEQIRGMSDQFDSGEFVDKQACYQSARELILNADEEFARKNMAFHNNVWSEVNSAIQLPYPQAHKRLMEIKKEFIDSNINCGKNPESIMTVLLCIPWYTLYSYSIDYKVFSNALLVAVEVYIIADKTGKLPDSLPEGLAKDLFSGGDFQYRKTDDGFVLACQGEDLEEHKVHEYEFKVKK
jgi:hypothetical protein